MADREANRAALERKRIQLARLRQERERRSQRQDENASPLNIGQSDRLESADDVLHALGLSASLSRASTAPSNVSAMDQSILSAQSPDTGSTVSQQTATSIQQQQPQQYLTSLNDSLQSSTATKTAVPLQVVHVNQINIIPKERVYYTKETQTPTAATAAAAAAAAAASQTNTSDPGAPQGEGAPQQKSYYGKQLPNAIPPALQPPNAIGLQTPESPTANNSLSQPNTQVAGVNQLALEWDDEFPGMFRSDFRLLSPHHHRPREICVQ